jgi:hypothetical protein
MRGKLILVIAVIGLLSFTFVPSENSARLDVLPEPETTENVIVLVIDGPRMTETFRDPTGQYIPHLKEDLAPQGVLFTNFKNNGVTNTNSGHAAITTGTYQNVKNDGSELPKQPSIFQYFLKETKKSKEKAWIVASKGKLNVLSNASAKGWNNAYMPSDFCGPMGNGVDYVADIFTWKKVEDVLNTHRPNLMLINLLEVDTRGHGGQWDNYLQAIKNTDEYALKLWNYIQSDEHYKGKTTLIITNDHGRHLDGHRTGYKEHGDGCSGCRDIYMVVLGPEFYQDKVIEEEYEQLDISKLVAELLKFDMPTSKGRKIKGLMREK